MNLEYLKSINELPLVTGFEHLFLDKLIDKIKSFDIEVSKLDLNIIHLNSDSNIVFLAHYDEIGFVVDNRYDKYLYRTLPMGLISWERGYGKVFQSIFEDRIIYGIGSSPMPHTKPDDERLFIELFEDLDLPPLWPFVFENRIIKSTNRLYSRALDNRANVVLLLELAKQYNINFILTHGEEQGTTRLTKTLDFIEKRIENPIYIVLDVIFSKSDQHAGYGIEENKLGYIAIEGGGTGNIATDDHVNLVKNITDIEVITKSKYEVTDATTLYRMGRKSIALVYGVRYLHSSLECLNLDTYKLAKTRLSKLFKN